jgi:hypothetical protein
VDQDRAALESERKALTTERLEIEALRAKLEAQDAEVTRGVRLMSEVVSTLTAYLGLPLPKMLSDAMIALEHEIEARAQELEPENPDRLAADDAGLSFSM